MVPLILFGLVWLRTKCGNHHPNAVTTVVAPGATELHQVQLSCQFGQLNSGVPELTTTLRQHYSHDELKLSYVLHNANARPGSKQHTNQQSESNQTDHNIGPPLQYFRDPRKIKGGGQARWMVFLQDFNYT